MLKYRIVCFAPLFPIILDRRTYIQEFDCGIYGSWRIQLFFYQGFLSRILMTHRTTGKERRPSFYSTLPLLHAHEHSNIYLQLCMRDDYHIIFNCTACVYQTVNRWDLPPHRIAIWLIDDLMLIFVLVLQANRLTNCKKIKPKHWTKGKIGGTPQS